MTAFVETILYVVWNVLPVFLVLCVHLRTFGAISAAEKKNNKNSDSINDETIVMLAPDYNSPSQ